MTIYQPLLKGANLTDSTSTAIIEWQSFLNALDAKCTSAIIEVTSGSAELLYTIPTTGRLETHLCYQTAYHQHHERTEIAAVKMLDVIIIPINPDKPFKHLADSMASAGYSPIGVHHGNCVDYYMHQCTEYGVQYEYARVYAKRSDLE